MVKPSWRRAPPSGLITVQGITTLPCVLAAPFIIMLFKLDPMHLSVLRLGMYSAFIQAAGALESPAAERYDNHTSMIQEGPWMLR